MGGESELIRAFPSVRPDEILSASMRQMTPRHSRSHGSFQSRGRSAPPCGCGVSMSLSVVAYGAALSISILFGADALPLKLHRAAVASVVGLVCLASVAVDRSLFLMLVRRPTKIGGFSSMQGKQADAYRRPRLPCRRCSSNGACPDALDGSVLNRDDGDACPSRDRYHLRRRVVLEILALNRLQRRGERCLSGAAAAAPIPSIARRYFARSCGATPL